MWSDSWILAFEPRASFMSDVVIRVENLGKRYRIGERERYVALRDMLARAISAPVRLFRGRKTSMSTSECHAYLGTQGGLLGGPPRRSGRDYWP